MWPLAVLQQSLAGLEVLPVAVGFVSGWTAQAVMPRPSVLPGQRDSAQRRRFGSGESIFLLLSQVVLG